LKKGLNMRNLLVNTALIAAMGLTPSLSAPVGAAGNKKNAGEARQPVTARGAELMAMIANAGDDGLMLTQDEGLDLVNSGYAQVDTSVTDGDTAKVTLTESGKAALGASGNSATSYEIEDNVPIPTNTARRGRTGGYPFEQLQLNQSFHVAVKADEQPADVAARLQSSVSGARARFSEPTGAQETVERKVYQRNADGSFVKDAEGKRVVASTEQVTRPVTRPTREFTVKAVGADDPKGPGARVWRVEVPGTTNTAS
jgi:hypothetical protein